MPRKQIVSGMMIGLALVVGCSQAPRQPPYDGPGLLSRCGTEQGQNTFEIPKSPYTAGAAGAAVPERLTLNGQVDSTAPAKSAAKPVATTPETGVPEVSGHPFRPCRPFRPYLQGRSE
jgi:hypothetical protein